MPVIIIVFKGANKEKKKLSLSLRNEATDAVKFFDWQVPFHCIDDGQDEMDVVFSIWFFGVNAINASVI